MIFTQFNGGSLLGGTTLGGTTTAVGGTVGVKQMQEQMRRIAFEFGKPKLDPAQYDGTMTLSTMIALANIAPIAGRQIHPAVGEALKVVELIKAPIKKVPYGSTVIELVLSPWIIDEVYSAILGIIRLIPGGGGVATGIDNGMKAAKSAVTSAAAPIATALMLVKKSTHGAFAGYDWSDALVGDGYSNGLGAITNIMSQLISPVTATAIAVASTSGSTTAPNPPPGYTWVAETPSVPGHWERARAGQTPQPGPTGATIQIRAATSAPGGVTCTGCAGIAPPPPMPPPVPGQPGVVRDHREWPKGKEIVTADWGGSRTYYGRAPKENLGARDRAAWEAKKNYGPFGAQPIPAIIPPGDLRTKLEKMKVRNGTIAFLIFQGFDKSRMGAFWDEQTQMLKITRVPEPSSSGPFDFVADAVTGAVDAVTDAASAAAGAVADIAQGAWNWIAENADDVYAAIKKYGCAIVNNDIVVGLAAAGAGVVASPAASAAVVSGAQAGKAGCAVLEIAEALYAIYKLLSMKLPQPVPLTSPNPPLVATFVPIRNLQLMMPATPPVTPPAKSRYPAGSITAFDPKLKLYRTAIPIGTRLPFGDAFGATATHFEVSLTEKAPPLVPVVPLTPLQKQTGTLPLYKNPWFWASIGVGVAAVGGGGYMLYRRRRSLTR